MRRVLLIPADPATPMHVILADQQFVDSFDRQALDGESPDDPRYCVRWNSPVDDVENSRGTEVLRDLHALPCDGAAACGDIIVTGPPTQRGGISTRQARVFCELFESDAHWAAEPTGPQLATSAKLRAIVDEHEAAIAAEARPRRNPFIILGRAFGSLGRFVGDDVAGRHESLVVYRRQKSHLRTLIRYALNTAVVVIGVNLLVSTGLLADTIDELRQLSSHDLAAVAGSTFLAVWVLRGAFGALRMAIRPGHEIVYHLANPEAKPRGLTEDD